MFRPFSVSLAATSLVAVALSISPAPAKADPSVATIRIAGRTSAAPVEFASYRYRYRSTGRRTGTSYTPWYLLPKTDPRRFNGPRYYYQ